MASNGKDPRISLTKNTSNEAPLARHSTGVVIGKFMPPHRGHEYLAQFASFFVDKLWIFVCSLPNEPIPGTQRYQWMQDLFPHATIIHIHEVNPAANRNQDGAQAIWAQAVLRHTIAKPDYVFASEEYGWAFAEALGAQFIPVDPSRDQFPISGSELRLRPFRNWHFLPTVVRSYFVKEIIIHLPEINQNHTDEIVQKAALLLNTLYVPIYRDFFQQFNISGKHQLNAEANQRAQYALINSLKTQARCFLLRSIRELKASSELIGKPDLIIEVDPHFSESGSGLISITTIQPEIDSNNIETLRVNCSLNTAPHAIRDLILDHYKELF